LNAEAAASKAREDEELTESTFKIMKGYLKNEKAAIFWGIFFLFGGSLSDFSSPIFIGMAVDLMNCDQYYEARIICIWMFCVVLFAGIMAGLRARLFNVMSDRIARDLKNEIFSKILICDTAFFDRKENMTGALLSRINADVEVIQGILSTNISMVLRGGTLIIAIMVKMLLINLKLAGVTFAALLLCISAVGSYGECMKRFAKLIAKEKSRMTSDALEGFTNIKTVKAFAAEDTEMAKFESGNALVYKAGMKKQIWTACFTLVQQLGMYGALIVICFMSYGLTKSGEITFGDMTQYLFYTNVLVF
jgi:ABC-type multidrug transport system fused ATPase/permease subunit